MADTKSFVTKAMERESVVSWRFARLAAAGFPPDLGERLAVDTTIDLHALLDLVDRGCPPSLAARILAPLDEPTERGDR